MLKRLDYPAPKAAAERILLLMLPGAGAHAADFAAHGLVADVQARNPGIDIIAAEPEMELYLDNAVADRLHTEIVQPARQRGYRRIWLLGISLGGAGALLYTAAHSSEVEGVLLLAPFLGTQGTIAALAGTGGISGSLDLRISTPPEQALLGWLRDYAASGRQKPPIYLAFGKNDRFSRGHRMLASLLPPERVIMRPGGHDWECWRRLLRRIMELQPFGA
jgi:alpha-beta hydrolase superfamily lysophospholipase